MSLSRRSTEVIVSFYHIARACTSGMGLLFLPIEIYTSVTNNPSPLDLIGFVLAGLALGLAVYFVDGEFITGFARKDVTWKIPSTNTSINICFGDILSNENIVAIGVNDRFDHIVDDRIISKGSLHGQVISRFWADPRDWKRAVEEKLPRRAGRTALRHPIGTCVDLERDNKLFLFFAVSETNQKSNVTSSNSEMLISSVKGMLSIARKVCANRPLSMPLVGSGLARVGLHSDGILHILLAAVTEECKSEYVTGTIRIVLRRGTESEVNLLQIMRTWS